MHSVYAKLAVYLTEPVRGVHLRWHDTGGHRWLTQAATLVKYAVLLQMHLTSPIAQPPRSSTHACAQVGTCDTVGMYVEEDVAAGADELLAEVVAAHEGCGRS